jgi:FlaG/FlaF family flagellin (archaellin)
MATLYTKVKLYIEENSATWDNTKVSLQNDSDGKGDYISSWTYSFSKPTDSQLATYETAGNTAESNHSIDIKRKTEYLSWQEQLDKLYHDIDDGKLDKTGSWYTHIKAVKDANSKG